MLPRTYFNRRHEARMCLEKERPPGSIPGGHFAFYRHQTMARQSPSTPNAEFLMHDLPKLELGQGELVA